MKRESRVYSYKEQLEEIQLKKELEEKRRQSGKPIQYTPKQKEAIKVQMAKEKTIREHVAKVSVLYLYNIDILIIICMYFYKKFSNSSISWWLKELD